MAKESRFPLKMKDGTDVDTFDSLREHFDLESVLRYFVDGSLIVWLVNNNCNEIADKIVALTPDTPNLKEKLSDIFGVEYQNTRTVSELYQEASKQENAEAQFCLGQICQYGRGVKQDDEEAVYWYQKAANQGHAEAQFYLGQMYEAGRGVDQDNRKAIELFRKAATQGYADALYYLGQKYENGGIVYPDNGKAAELYQKAANQGHAGAQFNLGQMYEAGRGVDQGLC